MRLSQIREAISLALIFVLSVAVFLGCTSTGQVGLWVYGYVALCPGTLEGSTGSGSGFKASQKTGQRLKVSSDRLVEAGNRPCVNISKHTCPVVK